MTATTKPYAAGAHQARPSSGGPPLTETRPTEGRPVVPHPAAESPTRSAQEGTASAGPPASMSRPTHPRWPIALIAAPAAVSTWSGWVGLGERAGFGAVRPLPGIADHIVINSAITLPVGVEAYAAYALHAWLSPASHRLSRPTRRFAAASAIGSLLLGMLGQVCYHQLTLAHATTAPGWVVTIVSCLPVLVLGMSAALLHMIRRDSHIPPQPASQDTATNLLSDSGARTLTHSDNNRTAHLDAASVPLTPPRTGQYEVDAGSSSKPADAHDPTASRTGDHGSLNANLHTFRTPPVASLIPKDELIADLVAQVLTAKAAGNSWRPDYDELRRRTGLSRSWCEKRVREARNAATHIERETTQGPFSENADQTFA